METELLSLNSTLHDKGNKQIETKTKKKKKTFKTKHTSSIITSYVEKIALIQDGLKDVNDKKLTPFWTLQSLFISNKLWLPTDLDLIEPIISTPNTSNKEKLSSSQAWFSIYNNKQSQSNVSNKYSPSSLFSLKNIEVKQVKTSTNKRSSETHFKTLKIRLLPTNDEKEQLKTILDQSRWYYNSLLSIYKSKPVNEQIKQFRDYDVYKWLTDYDYVEVEEATEIKKEFKTRENKENKTHFTPLWWSEKGKLHSRTPRGAAKKFTQNINSAVSNFQNKNISKFEMHFIRKDNKTQFALFEDKAFPSILKKLKVHIRLQIKTINALQYHSKIL